jgi:hypothetical protein
MTTNQEPGVLPFKVKAKFDYQPTDSKINPSLSLCNGEVYDVTLTDGAGLWWFGRDKAGREGWFPAGYTEVLPVHSQQPPPLPPLTQQPPLLNQAQNYSQASPQQNFQQGAFRQNSNPGMGQHFQHNQGFGQQGMPGCSFHFLSLC